MNKTGVLNLSFAAIIAISNAAISAQITVNEFGQKIEIETRDLYFYELINYWNTGDDDVKARIEAAIDAGDYQRPTQEFEAPEILVDHDDLSGGFVDYIRLRERVLGGDRHAGFRAWYLAWFRAAHDLGPRFRARFLAFEAFDNALRARFAARRDPARLILVDQYKELGERFARAEDNPNLTFGDLYDLMQDVPSLTPEADNEGRRSEVQLIVERSLRNTAFLWKKAREMGKQQLLDIAGEYDALAAEAADLLRRNNRVAPAALQRLYERAAALHAQQRTIRAQYEEPAEEFSEVSLTSESDEGDEASERKRSRSDDERANEAEEERPRLVLRLKLTPGMLDIIKRQGPGSGGSGL